MREREAVTKSKLLPSKNAPVIARYLKLRSQDISRTRILNELDLDIAKTSAVGIEWNALTYAGHTVWNVHNENIKGSGYKGGTKRRPRPGWLIAENTHEPLFTTEEAEVILTQLEQSSNSRNRRTPASYLLTGILKTPRGDPWHGDGGERCVAKAKGQVGYTTPKGLPATTGKSGTRSGHEGPAIAEVRQAAHSRSYEVP